MKLPFSGGCRCGHIKYSCNSAPDFVYYCHCKECQRTTGSAFHVGLSVPLSHLTMLGAEPTKHSRPAESGNVITEAFCPVCGCPIYVHGSGRPERVSLKAGSLDDSSWVNPDVEIWTKSKASWCDSNGAKISFEEGRK